MNRKILMVVVTAMMVLSTASIIIDVSDAEVQSLNVLDVGYDPLSGYMVVFVDRSVDGEQFSLWVDSEPTDVLAVGTSESGSDWIVFEWSLDDRTRNFELHSISGSYQTVSFQYPKATVPVFFEYRDYQTKVEVPYGETISLFPQIEVHSGERFLHWSLTPGGYPFDFNEPVTSSICLYAVFEEVPFTENISVGAASLGGSVMFSVVSLDDGFIPMDMDLVLTFTALKRTVVLGKEILAPTTFINHYHLSTWNDEMTYVIISLPDVIGNNESIIGVRGSVGDVESGYLSLGFR